MNLKKIVFTAITAFVGFVGVVNANPNDFKPTNSTHQTNNGALVVDTTLNRVGINMPQSIASASVALEVSGTVSSTAFITGGSVTASSFVTSGFTAGRTGYAVFDGSSVTSATVAVSDSQNLSNSTVSHLTTGNYNFQFKPNFCTAGHLPVVVANGFKSGSPITVGLVSATAISATINTAVSATSVDANNMAVEFRCQ